MTEFELDLRSKKLNPTFEDLYRREFDDNLHLEGYECNVFGSAGIMCKPCPRHRDDPFDVTFFNYYDTQQNRWYCAKDLAPIGELPPLQEPDETLDQIRRLSKVSAKQREDFRTVIVEHHYLSNNLIISIEIGGQEGYKAFRYKQEKGVYVILGPGVIITELEGIYTKFWNEEKPQSTKVPQMKRRVYEQTVRPEGFKVFLHDEGDYFYLPVKGKDIKISRATGEVQPVDMDPVNRPFLYRLQREVSPPKSQDIPKILRDLKYLIPPQHYDNLVVMLSDTLLGRGERLIFYNFSRTGGNGKSTFFNLMERLYGPDMVYKLPGNRIADRFSFSGLIGKTALLIEDYPAWGTAEPTLTTLASPGNEKVEGEENVGGTIPIEKKYEDLMHIPLMARVIINSNLLAFNPTSTYFMDRLVIIPWIRKFDSDKKPPTYSKEDVDELLSWLVYVALPRRLRGELKWKRVYSTDQIVQWAIESAKGVQFTNGKRIMKDNRLNVPYNGMDKFVEEYVCKPNAPKCVLTKTEEAFDTYLRFCGREGILPLADKEFIQELEERQLLKEKDGEIYVNVKKGLLLFM